MSSKLAIARIRNHNDQTPPRQSVSGSYPIVRIENRSEWPTDFVAILVEWIAEELPMDCADRRFILRATTKPDVRRGRALLGQDFFSVTCSRKLGERVETYYRYKDAENYFMKSSLETLILVIAHEMYHTTRENMADFFTGRSHQRSGRLNRKMGEIKANRKGFEIVEKWRAYGRRRVLSQLREHRRDTPAIAGRINRDSYNDRSTDIKYIDRNIKRYRRKVESAQSAEQARKFERTLNRWREKKTQAIEKIREAATE